MLTFAEMFCGIGGFRLGLKRANLAIGTAARERARSIQREHNALHQEPSSPFSCVWANDNDKYACQIYRKNFGNKELVEADIRTIQTSSIPTFDLLTAGFPCQAFSVAGKRKGIKESRGTLFHHIARVAAAKKPKLLLLENVRGLLSSSLGRDFAIILRTLGKLGYLLEWQVLNSKHFGVPQNRQRVFIIGHLGEGSSKQIFPVGETCQYPARSSQKTQGERSRIWTANSLLVEGSGRERNLITNTLKSRYYKDGSALSSVQKGNLVMGVTLANRSRYSQGVIRTPLKQDSSSFALNSVGDQGVLAGKRIRRLTPTECERLQGFPDGWTSGISDTQRYKCLGNAVTTNVVQFLGERLLEVSVAK